MLLIETGDRRPDPPPEREPIVLPLSAVLRFVRRQWAWFAAVVCLVVSMLIPGWVGLIPLWWALYFFCWGLTHLYRGNHGLSHYHQ
jgi:hypothetical protein